MCLFRVQWGVIQYSLQLVLTVRTCRTIPTIGTIGTQYYVEGVGKLNVHLITKFDEDRCNIAKAWGYDPVNVETCLRK